MIDAVMRTMAKARGLLNLILLPPGATYTNRTGTVTGFKELRESARESLASAADMPQTNLYQDTPSGLNTDDSASSQRWDRTCAGRWKSAYYPALVDLYRLIFASERGAFKGKTPTSWDIERHPIYLPSQKETAEIRKIHADTDCAYVNAGVLSPDHVAKSRWKDTGYGDEILPVEDLPEEDPNAAAQAEEEVRQQVRATVKPGEVAQPANEAAKVPLADAEEFRARQFTVPAGARGNAQKVLEWRKEHGEEVKGMTATGWGRARQLAQEPSISGQDIIEINAWFARHGAQASTKEVPAELKDTPWRDAGYVSWLGWGGDTMKTFAAEKVEAGRNDALFSRPMLLKWASQDPTEDHPVILAVVAKEGFDLAELTQGTREEMEEHGVDLATGIEMASVHLRKNAHYYSLVKTLIETNEPHQETT
jgi:hypothetical protein